MSNFTLFANSSPILDNRGAKRSATNPLGGTCVKFYLEGRYAHFAGIENETIAIAYECFPLDDNGVPTIEPNHQMAVTAYIRYMLQHREYSRGKIPQHVYLEAKNMWALRCKQADHSPLSQQDRALCKAILNSLKPFPLN